MLSEMRYYLILMYCINCGFYFLFLIDESDDVNILVIEIYIKYEVEEVLGQKEEFLINLEILLSFLSIIRSVRDGEILIEVRSVFLKLINEMEKKLEKKKEEV